MESCLASQSTADVYKLDVLNRQTGRQGLNLILHCRVQLINMALLLSQASLAS